MKKFLKFSLSLFMLLSVFLPMSIHAQEVTPDTVLLGVINSLKDMSSFKGEFDGAMSLEYEEGNADFTTDGSIQLKVSPEIEFGFDLELLMDAVADDGSTENQSLVIMSYLVGQDVYLFQDDSAEEADGQWETYNITEMGINTQQIAQQYQMLVSMFEGVIRSYYLPSELYGLISEKTMIESTSDGYQVVINSFETEEEWIEFFEALEELGESATNQAEENTGMNIEASLDDFEDLEEQARALAEGLTYTITINTDNNYFIQSISLVVDTDVEKLDQGSTTTSSDSETETPESVTANFNYQLTDTNFDGSIDLPADLPR